MSIFDNIREHIALKNCDSKSIENYLSHKYSESFVAKWETSKLFWFLNLKSGIFRDFLIDKVGIDFNHFNIDKLIKTYTLEESNRGINLEEATEIVSALCGDFLEDVEIIDDESNKGMRLTTKDGKIGVTPLSYCLNVEDEIKQKWLSSDRYGVCHFASLWLSKKFTDGTAELVTGVIGNSGYLGKYLHSWVETECCGEPMCLDSTRNGMFNKDGYYRLMDVDENNLTKIPNEIVRQEQKKFFELYEFNPWFTKLYVDNREEAMVWYDRIFSKQEDIIEK